MPQLLQMSDKAPSSAASSPNSCISSSLDDENKPRRIGGGPAGEAAEAAKAERAEKAFSAAEAPKAEGAATDPDPSGRPGIAAATAVQSQLNHYARGLIMVQK